METKKEIENIICFYRNDRKGLLCSKCEHFSFCNERINLIEELVNKSSIEEKVKMISVLAYCKGVFESLKENNIVDYSKLINRIEEVI